jgi:phosphodiesterase/alkaline phosphatase D-like protein
VGCRGGEIGSVVLVMGEGGEAMRGRAYSLKVMVLVLLGVLIGMLAASAPALAAAPEEPTTEAPLPIAGTTATFKGELNPGASAEEVTYYFAYSQGAASACTESGVNDPAEGFPKTKGNHKKVTLAVAGLEGNTEYTVCLMASNGELTQGTTKTFKTLAIAPVVVGARTSGETPFAATLTAEVNPENEETTSCEFEYGKTTSYGSTAPCEPELFSGTGMVETSASLTGLESGTTYDYRVAVTNAKGTVKGGAGQFETLALKSPSIEAESFSELTSTGVTLGGSINPNYQETTYLFEYSTSESAVEKGEGEPIPGPEPLLAESTPLSVSVTAGSLAPRTTYYYRVVATNGTGTTDGLVEHFTTQATPVVTAGVAEDVTRSSASLVGELNPSGAGTTYHIVYASQASYEQALAESNPSPYALGASTVESAEVGSNYEAHVVGPVVLSELTPATTYHYALVATNSAGTTVGPDGTFTTGGATPPIVTTGVPAEGVSELSATINGTVDTRGLPTTAQFQLLASGASEPSPVPASALASVGTLQTFTATFNGGLQAATTYEYRLVAKNPDGTSYGAWQSFATDSFPNLAIAAPVGPTTLPLPSIVEPPAPKLAPKPKPLTRAQKLSKALKACQKKPKKQRASCKRQAEKKYGPVKKKK